jgi:hypothetical protein
VGEQIMEDAGNNSNNNDNNNSNSGRSLSGQQRQPTTNHQVGEHILEDALVTLSLLQ